MTQQMTPSHMSQVLETLDTTYDEHPMGELTAGNPFRVLVSCIISLRTKDEVTIPASQRLFVLADSVEAMAALPVDQIAQCIYPCGFYKTKALTIQQACQDILQRYDGQVPDTIEALMTLKGVGRKTANLVVGLGHLLPAICVDIHVHRICNRLGWLETNTPDETEMVLRQLLPVQYWSVINRVMVMHGRAICKAIGAQCDQCPVAAYCAQVNVKKRKVPKTPTVFIHPSALAE